MKNITEKYKKILERAEYSAGNRTVRLVSVAQQLMPEIEKGIRKQVKLFEARKSDSVAYQICMKDIEKKMGDMALNISIESMFLILSGVAWHNDRCILTEINISANDQRLGLWFRFGLGTENEEPSVESCTEQRMMLYQEA